jgi:hypothetical protein
MRSRTKVILAFTILMMVSLACATLTGGGAPQDPPAPAIPSDTPLPPLPTITPLPPTPEPTEEPAAPQNPGGEVLFWDDFSDPDSGWDRFNNDEGMTDYFDGAYKITVNKDTHFFWANPYRTFGDQIIEVEATVLSTATDNQYGIVCRHLDVDNWYALVISSDGYAAIRKRFQGSDLEYIADWVESPTIHLANSSNNLRAECVGPRLALYVNGMLAIEVIDTDIATGDGGLIAGTFEAPSIEVLFDNFQVSAP